MAFCTNVFNLFALSMYYHLPVTAASIKGLSVAVRSNYIIIFGYNFSFYFLSPNMKANSLKREEICFCQKLW